MIFMFSCFFFLIFSLKYFIDFHVFFLYFIFLVFNLIISMYMYKLYLLHYLIIIIRANSISFQAPQPIKA